MTASTARACESIKHLGIQDVLIAHRSLWQTPFAERRMGSIRRECPNHVIVFNEAHPPRTLKSHCAYHHESCNHLSLERNAPVPRPVEPPTDGAVIAIRWVGGLHHRCSRAA